MLVRDARRLAGEPIDAHVNVEVITGITDIEQVVPFSSARNTSNQVRAGSLADQAGEFEFLKQALVDVGIDPEMIAWHENDDGLLHHTELIALLTLYDRSRFSVMNHPVQAYSGKAATLRYFRLHPETYVPILPLIGDIVKIPEWIRHHLPTQQLASYGSNFGNFTGINGAFTPRPQPITGLTEEYEIPTAYIYPLAAVFRAMIDDSGPGYVWDSNFSVFELIEKGLTSHLFRLGVVPSINQLRNATSVGKTVAVWTACYASAREAAHEIMNQP